MPDQGLFCATCGRQTMHRGAGQVNHILHFLITFLTCGLWAFVWLMLAMSASSSGHLCTACGTFYDPTRVPGWTQPPGPPVALPPIDAPPARTALIVLGSVIGVLAVGSFGFLGVMYWMGSRAKAVAPPTSPTTLQAARMAPSGPALLAQLPEEERRISLQGSVTGTGKDCLVTRTFLQGERYGTAFWNVACSNGKGYAVKVPPDAKASRTVLDCAKALASDRCFSSFD